MSRQHDIPSFSIIVETENLSLADFNRLSGTLQSLANQDIPIERAAAVIVQDSGNVPTSDLAELQRSFPWMSTYGIAHDAGHYEAKIQCTDVVRSDVVIFCDSDCLYQPEWLRHLLLPLTTDEAIQVVSGETQMEATSPFGLAMLLTHVFSPYSDRDDLYPSDTYNANNVAFRREFLKTHPIPVHLPLYRGNCVIHARRLADCGITIWKQPRSRAIHALPENFAHFCIRFLKMGGDALQVSRITAAGDRTGATGFILSVLGVIYGKLRDTVKRGLVQWKRRPRRAGHFVLAVPLIAVAHMLFIGGVVIKVCRRERIQRQSHAQHKPA